MCDDIRDATITPSTSLTIYHMISDPAILNYLHSYVDFTEVIPLLKGYSLDQKYLLLSRCGKKYLARITTSDDTSVITSRREQFNLLLKLRNYSLFVPEPYQFQITDHNRTCLMILDYIEGDDGEEAICRLSSEEQYKIGYQAGEELRKLHQLPAPAGTAPWHQAKKLKYERYCAAFADETFKTLNIDFDIDAVQQYVYGQLHLMEGIEQTFQHDDYHPANLIIQNGHLNGIIDFNRSDWGDPVHDFYKVAMFTRHISIPFARGQVDGYCCGSVTSDFWSRYSLYCAMSIIPDLVWSGRYSRQTGSDELEHSINRVQAIIRDHLGFSRIIPKWYRD